MVYIAVPNICISCIEVIAYFTATLYFKIHWKSTIMVPTAKEILFSRTKYTRFKGNNSRYVQKTYIYSVLFNYLYFMVHLPHPF